MLPGLRTAQGVLYVTTVAPVASDPRVGGVAVTAAGSIRASVNGIPQAFANAHGVRNNGALCVNTAGTQVSNHVNGLPVNSVGQLVCQLNQTPAPSDPYVGGIRVGPLGGVYITDAAPTPPFSFSTGFNDGYF